MLKIVVFLLCAGLLYVLVKNSFAARKKKDEVLPAKNMVKDPVCGTFVSEETDIKLRYKGEIYAFCSEECKEKFRAKAAGE